MSYGEMCCRKCAVCQKISARRLGCAHNRVAPRQAFGLQVALAAYVPSGANVCCVLSIGCAPPLRTTSTRQCYSPPLFHVGKAPLPDTAALPSLLSCGKGSPPRHALPPRCGLLPPGSATAPVPPYLCTPGMAIIGSWAVMNIE